MKIKPNKRLMRKMRAKNYIGLSEQWVESMAGEEPIRWDASFFMDMFPGCWIESLEVKLPLPGIDALFAAGVTMRCDEGVFTLVGTGNTYEAALVSAVWDSLGVADRDYVLGGTSAPF